MNKSAKIGVLSALAAMTPQVDAYDKEEDVCRALVMSGGGNNGAWEIGVLWGMVNNGDPADFTFDVLTGVSAGAINSGGMVGWPIGKEVEMAQWMSDMWRNLKTSDIWQEWNLGFLSGVFLMGGAVDNSPMLNFLNHTIGQFNNGFQRRVTISAANVNNGDYVEFDQTNIAFSELAAAAKASASIPFVFPPHHWERKGGMFMDGGTIYNVNMEAAVRQCMEVVDDESKIIIDVYICGDPESPAEEASTSRHGWENYYRGHKLRKYYGNIDSLAYSIAAHPTVQMRYVVGQSMTDHVGGLDELNMDGDFTWGLQEIGRNDAISALNRDSTANILPFFKEWLTDPSLQIEYGKLGDYIPSRIAEERLASLFEVKLNN